MIVLYSGTPGSGKSLDCSKQIYIKLKLGKNVIGNMIVNADILKKCKGKYFYIDTFSMRPKDFIDYAEKYHVKGKEGQTLIVIDECQQIFNAREWAAPHMKEWNTFFQVHRHYGFNIYLITQYDRLIDRQTRALIEYERIHRKVSNMGFVGMMAGIFFKGGLFVCVEKYYSIKLKTGSYYFAYKRKFGNFYDSYALCDKKNECRNDLRDFLNDNSAEEIESEVS